jgi:ABC-type nitrate/sulfonate/bicarbonate transport system permease component
MKRTTVYRLAILVLATGSLEIASRLQFIDATVMPPPSRMVAGAWDVLRSPEMRAQVLISLKTIAAALILSIIAGFVLGVLLHRYPRVRNAANPLLSSYYSIPIFVFYPAFIVLFGLNRWPLVAIGFLFAIVAVAVSTLDGLNRVPHSLLRTAQVMKLGRLRTLYFVVIPSASPWLFTAVKFGVAYSFLGVIAGEFILAEAGIGHAIAFSYNAFDNFRMYGLIVILLTLVGFTNAVFWIWEQRLYARRTGG